MSSKGKGYSSVPERELVRIDDLRFDGGMYSVKNGVLIPRNCSSQTKNVIADEHYALTKMPGIELLVTEANNRFADNPGYRVFTHITPEGQEKLITVAHDSNGVMKVWSLDAQSSYPANTAMTDITPTNGLTAGVRPCLWDYRGSLYLTNGVDPLMRWGGDTTWHEYATNKTERFRYGTVFDSCLFLASSNENPNRVVFSIPNRCYVGYYYYGGYNSNYAARTFWVDIPSRRGDRILWLLDFYGALVILKTHSIWGIYGSPVNDTHSLKCLSEDKGVVDGATVQVRGDHVLFVNQRGIGVYGNKSVVVSQQDQRLLTNPNVAIITQPIQNWWDDNISFVKPADTRELIYNGSSLDTLFTTKTQAVYKTAAATDDPPVIIFDFTDTLPTSEVSQTTNTNWIDLRSTNNEFFSQSLKLLASSTKVIGQYLLLYLKSTGTLTAAQTVDVFLCDGQEDDTEPNKTNAYAQTQLTGDVLVGMRCLPFTSGSRLPVAEETITGHTSGATAVVKDILITAGVWGSGTAVGYLWIKTQSGTFQSEDLDIGDELNVATIAADSSPLSTGCWIKAELTYHNYPQTMLPSTSDIPVVFIQLVPTGDTDSIYLSWGYNSAGGYASGRMYNSDPENPASQEGCDYDFILYCNRFDPFAILGSDPITAASDFVKWANLFVTLDENTFDDYTRSSKIKVIYYALSSESYATWHEIPNGGAFPNITDDTIKIKIYLQRGYVTDPIKMDSFSLTQVRLSYCTKTAAESLRGSEIYKGRYYVSATIVDPDQVEA